MAFATLKFPEDIKWKRLCVTESMMDPEVCGRWTVARGGRDTPPSSGTGTRAAGILSWRDHRKHPRLMGAARMRSRPRRRRAFHARGEPMRSIIASIASPRCHPPSCSARKSNERTGNNGCLRKFLDRVRINIVAAIATFYGPERIWYGTLRSDRSTGYFLHRHPAKCDDKTGQYRNENSRNAAYDVLESEF
jgi:hypothetical protein